MKQATRESGSVDAVLVERVRRHFHRDGLDTRVAHPRQQRLQLGRLGCGVAQHLAVCPYLVSTVPITPVLRPAASAIASRR